MIWTLDTGVRGSAGCKDSADLRAVLEAAMAHHADTGSKAAEAAILKSTDPKAQERNDFDHIKAKSAEAAAAKARFEKKLPSVQEQMKAGIDSACALADFIGGPVTASISGHLSRAHASGVENRLQVSVDSALPQDE